jgi:hypothetical protein
VPQVIVSLHALPARGLQSTVQEDDCAQLMALPQELKPHLIEQIPFPHVIGSGQALPAPRLSQSTVQEDDLAQLTALVHELVPQLTTHFPVPQVTVSPQLDPADSGAQSMVQSVALLQSTGPLQLFGGQVTWHGIPAGQAHGPVLQGSSQVVPLQPPVQALGQTNPSGGPESTCWSA